MSAICIAPECSAPATLGRGCDYHGRKYENVAVALKLRKAKILKRAPVTVTKAPPLTAEAVARYVIGKGRATAAEIAKAFGVSQRTASRRAQEAGKAGLLLPVGGHRGWAAAEEPKDASQVEAAEVTSS